MTETTPQDEQPLHPAEILLNVIVVFLTRMFLGACGGDLDLARLAAIETVNAYGARNQADLIAIGQVIACGLAALGSLSRSMEDDLSLPMTLRLRSNANALMRAAELSRRVIKDIPPEPGTPQPDAGPDPFEAEVLANLALTQKRVAESRARPPEPEPQPEPTPAPAARTGGDPLSNQRWAAAMTKVAGEFAASLPGLPPAERKQASLRAAVLTSCANDVLCGNLPPRLRPGALSAIMQPNPP